MTDSQEKKNGEEETKVTWKETTIEEIKKDRKELFDIENMEDKAKQKGRLRTMAKRLSVYILSDEGAATHVLLRNIYTHLQSEMMYLACVSAEESSKLAERACFRAAIAAWLCLLGVIAAWITVVISIRAMG